MFLTAAVLALDFLSSLCLTKNGHKPWCGSHHAVPCIEPTCGFLPAYPAKVETHLNPGHS